MVANSGNTIGTQAVMETAAFQRGLNEYISGLTQASRATTQATGQMSSMGQAGSAASGGGMSLLSGAVMGVGFAIANTMIGAVQGAISAIGNLASSGVQAVATLQDLTITMESLAAREIVMAGGADNITDAMGQAAPMAAHLLEQIKALSLASPFEYQQIVSTFNMSMAFGQSSEMALKLTKSITDLAAVNKSVPGIIDRITYNFNQMNLVGQISQRDIKDLAMAGLNFADVLRTEMGMSIEEVNAALKSGDKTFKDVSEAFVRYTERNFAGASERASRTLNGLVSSFKDLAFFASQDVLGPSLERITTVLGDLLNTAMDFVQSGALRDVGIVLDMFTESLLNNSVGEDYTYGFLVDMRDGLGNAASEAFDWGQNIIFQFAEGILNGAATALNAAMDFIGKMLNYFLAPGSPPRVAPSLDRWGTSAMNEYLRGFTEADFDILDTLQGPLKSAFDLLESAGALGAGGAEQMFADISKQMIAALSSGDVVDESFFTNIANSAGEFGASIAELAREQFELAAAGDKVAAAEAAIADARKREQNAGIKVNKLTQQYNALLRGGASGDVLKRKLAEINAAEKERQVASEQATEAEGQLSSAQEQLDLQRAQFDMQKKLVDQLLEIAQAQARAADEAERAAKAAEDKQKAEEKAGGGAGAGEGAGGGGGIDIPDLPDLGGGLEETINEARERIMGKLRELWQSIVDSIKERLGPALEEFKKAWQRVVDFITPIWENIKKGWGLVIDFIRNHLNEFSGFWKKWWAEHGDSVKKIVNGVWTFLKSIFKGGFVLLAALVRGGLRGFQVWWKKYGTDVMNIVRRTWATIKANFKDFFEIIGDLLDAFVALFTGDWKTFWQKVKEIGAGIWRIIHRTWSMAIDNMLDVWKIASGSLKDAWDATMRHLHQLAVWLYGKLSDVWNDVKAVATRLWGNIKTIVIDLWNGTVDTVQSAALALYKYLQGKWDDTKKAADTIWKALKALVTKLWQEAVDAVQLAALALYNYLQTKWSEIKSVADTAWKAIKTAVQTIWQQTVDFITTKAEELRSAISAKLNTILENIRTWLANALQAVRDKFTEIYTAGSDLIENMRTGIGEKLAEALANIHTWLVNAFAELENSFTGWLQKGRDLIGNLKSGIDEILPNALASISGWITGAITAIEGYYDSFVTKGKEIIQKIIAGLDEIGADIKTRIGSFVSSASEIAASVWESFRTVGSTLISKITEGIGAVGSTISDAIGDAITGAGQGLNQVYESIKDIGRNIITKIGEGISGALNSLVNALEGTLRDLISNVFGTVNGNSGFYAVFKQIGENIWTGLGNGIRDAADAVLQAATGAVQSVINAIRDLLGIASPSRLMKSLGKSSIIGYAVGWKEDAGAAASIIGSSIQRSLAPVYAAARQPIMSPTSVQRTNNYSFTANMGGVNIYNQMDDAAFEARMLRIMRRAGRSS